MNWLIIIIVLVFLIFIFIIIKLIKKRNFSLFNETSYPLIILKKISSKFLYHKVRKRGRGKKQIEKRVKEKLKEIYSESRKKKEEEQKREGREFGSGKRKKIKKQAEEEKKPRKKRKVGGGKGGIKIGKFERAGIGGTGEGIKINTKNFAATLKYIDNKTLLELIIKLKKEGLIKFDDKSIILTSKEDIEEYYKQEIIDFLNSRYENLKQKISELRKDGKDTGVLDYQLLEIPLKINLFKSTFNQKDFDKVFGLMKRIEESIK